MNEQTKIHYISIDRTTYAHGYRGKIERKTTVCIQRAPLGKFYTNANQVRIFRTPTKASLKRCARAQVALNKSGIAQ